ncbi:MAG: HNH endonuclease, partial [Actinomycetaceae bacterium]|nr:HNH endonuclease [Actinomycetaceae bacterium]
DGLEVANWDGADGYARENFGERWVDVDGNGCNTRNDILGRDLTDIEYTSNKYRCVVKSGELDDPYSGQRIHFDRSKSNEVQIDHIVALYNAWRTGAQDFSYKDRVAFANDPYNLIAVDGDTNYEKSDADASRWLPRDEDFRCEYVARQIGMKARYNLWVTEKEKKTLRTVLNTECQGTELPSYDAIR